MRSLATTGYFAHAANPVSNAITATTRIVIFRFEPMHDPPLDRRQSARLGSITYDGVRVHTQCQSWKLSKNRD